MRLQVSMDFANNAQSRLEFRDVEQTTDFVNVAHIDDVFELPTGNEGYKGFQVSGTVTDPITPLNGTYKFFDDTKGYSGALSCEISGKEKGQYGYPVSVDIRFHINNIIPETFMIVFDTVNNEYAPYFGIFSEEKSVGVAVFDNTSPVVILRTADGLLKQSDITDTFVLRIFYWSKPNASVKVSRIAAYPRFDFGSKDIVKMLCSENLFDSSLQIRPGICEQYANIDVYDRYNVLHSMYLRAAFSENKNNRVNIYAVDDSEQKTYLLGSYDIVHGNVSWDNSVVAFECQDGSRLFEFTEIEALSPQDRTCDDLLSLLFTRVNVSWKYADSQTEKLCKTIKTPNCWSEAGNAKVLLDKICILGMLRIYWYIDTFIVARCVNVNT